MSTYVYLQCLNHNPPLRAEEESGQHLYDLPQIRSDIAKRETLVEILDQSSGYADIGYFRNRTLRFLSQHRLCAVGIIDEYGREHPVVEEEPS